PTLAARAARFAARAGPGSVALLVVARIDHAVATLRASCGEGHLRLSGELELAVPALAARVDGGTQAERALDPGAAPPRIERNHPGPACRALEPRRRRSARAKRKGDLPSGLRVLDRLDASDLPGRWDGDRRWRGHQVALGRTRVEPARCGG